MLTNAYTFAVILQFIFHLWSNLFKWGCIQSGTFLKFGIIFCFPPFFNNIPFKFGAILICDCFFIGFWNFNFYIHPELWQRIKGNPEHERKRKISSDWSFENIECIPFNFFGMESEDVKSNVYLKQSNSVAIEKNLHL